VHQIVQEAITRTDLDLRKALYHNIVLSGGSTLCKNFPDRLMREIKRLAVEDMKIRISAPAERKYTTWIGGSILAGLSTFRKVCKPRISLINPCLFVLLDVGKRGRMA
jgi:centractin